MGAKHLPLHDRIKLFELHKFEGEMFKNPQESQKDKLGHKQTKGEQKKTSKTKNFIKTPSYLESKSGKTFDQRKGGKIHVARSYHLPVITVDRVSGVSNTGLVTGTLNSYNTSSKAQPDLKDLTKNERSTSLLKLPAIVTEPKSRNHIGQLSLGEFKSGNQNQHVSVEDIKPKCNDRKLPMRIGNSELKSGSYEQCVLVGNIDVFDKPNDKIQKDINGKTENEEKDQNTPETSTGTTKPIDDRNHKSQTPNGKTQNDDGSNSGKEINGKPETPNKPAHEIATPIEVINAQNQPKDENIHHKSQTPNCKTLKGKSNDKQINSKTTNKPPSEITSNEMIKAPNSDNRTPTNSSTSIQPKEDSLTPIKRDKLKVTFCLDNNTKKVDSAKTVVASKKHKKKPNKTTKTKSSKSSTNDKLAPLKSVLKRNREEKPPETPRPLDVQQTDDRRFENLHRSLTRSPDKTDLSFTMLSPASWPKSEEISDIDMRIIREKYQPSIKKRMDASTIYNALQNALDKRQELQNM